MNDTTIEKVYWVYSEKHQKSSRHSPIIILRRV